LGRTFPLCLLLLAGTCWLAVSNAQHRNSFPVKSTQNIKAGEVAYWWWLRRPPTMA
jgi:hypothetical protein